MTDVTLFIQMKQKVLAVRISDDVYQAIQSEAESSGQSLSVIASKLLSEALASTERVDTKALIASDIAKLAARVRQLEASLSSQHGQKGKRRR